MFHIFIHTNIYRKYAGAGNSDLAKKLRLNENEGVSILRCNREVLYGHVPYLIGKRGQYKSYEIDRFWGLEISFPPELDDYFHVRFIKRGAEPISELRNFIRDIITPKVIYARNEIRKVFGKEKETSTDGLSKTLASIFYNDNKESTDITIEEFEKIIEEIPSSYFNDYEYKEIIDLHIQDNRETISLNLMKYKFSISFAELPIEELYAFDEINDYNIIVINKNHKYIKEIIYQSIEEDESKSSSNNKIFESQVAALIAPLVTIDKMKNSINKKAFSAVYGEVLNNAVINKQD